MKKVDLVWAALLVVLVAACSSGTNVGSGVNTKVAASGQLGIGTGTSTTLSASSAIASHGPTTSAPTRRTPTTAATHVTAPPVTAAKTATAHAYVIGIYGDNSGKSAFDPSQAAVYVGTKVEWVNDDTVAHSVVADSRAFSSPSIPAGGSWSYVAGTVGQFGYQDGTRPYAVGTLQVEAT